MEQLVVLVVVVEHKVVLVLVDPAPLIKDLLAQTALFLMVVVVVVLAKLETLMALDKVEMEFHLLSQGLQ
jgi:hypothetical protein